MQRNKYPTNLCDLPTHEYFKIFKYFECITTKMKQYTY